VGRCGAHQPKSVEQLEQVEGQNSFNTFAKLGKMMLEAYVETLESILIDSLKFPWKGMLLVTVESLCKLKLYLLPTSHWKLTQIFTRMLSLLEERTLDTERGYKLSPSVLFQAVRIASEYSAIDQFDFAQGLFSSIIPHITFLSDSQYGMQKAEANLLFAFHYQRQQLWGDCAARLVAATRYISSNIGQNDVATTRYLKTALDELDGNLWNYDGYSVQELLSHHIERLISLLPGIGMTGRCSSRKATNDLASSDAMSISTRSYQYGVTYSVSEVTGVSDSVFMVP
jgi:hypothetical protein